MWYIWLSWQTKKILMYITTVCFVNFMKIIHHFSMISLWKSAEKFYHFRFARNSIPPKMASEKLIVCGTYNFLGETGKLMCRYDICFFNCTKSYSLWGIDFSWKCAEWSTISNCQKKSISPKWGIRLYCTDPVNCFNLYTCMLYEASDHTPFCRVPILMVSYWSYCVWGVICNSNSNSDCLVKTESVKMVHNMWHFNFIFLFLKAEYYCIIVGIIFVVW